MAMTTDIRGNGYSKNSLICDCAGKPTHAITTLLSNSLLVNVNCSAKGNLLLSVGKQTDARCGRCNLYKAWQKRESLANVSARKDSCETFIRLFWKAGLLICFQDSEK